MSVVELTCIRCPMGCQLTVVLGADGSGEVRGNRCPRGRDYGLAEATMPVRTVAASVWVPGCAEPLSVKTASPVPRELVRQVAAAIAHLKLTAPIAAGDVVCEDICGTGAAVVATKSLGVALAGREGFR